MSCTIGRSSTFGLKPPGCSVACVDQRRRRKLLIADDEVAVLLADRAPAAAVEMEQREAVVLRVHLRVVAARGQIGAGERRQLDRLARHRQLAREDLADERLRRRIGRVVDDQPAVAEHALRSSGRTRRPCRRPARRRGAAPP